MKVVLFCGGFGMRLREYSDSCPKPMVHIGYRPILWHIMKYYAHFGHKEFILCLGWRANVIKEYFLNYDECVSNDFVFSSGGGEINLLNADIQDWKITFVDTGPVAKIGERLKAIEKHVCKEEAFLANYADGLTDLYLPNMIDFFQEKESVASFLSVQPQYNSFHAVETDEGGLVRAVEPIENVGVWMNGGFFVFTPEIFEYLGDGQELVDEPFAKLIAKQKLHSYRYNGFWACMDTFKEKEMLDDMFATGNAPWEVWRGSSDSASVEDLGSRSRAKASIVPQSGEPKRSGRPALLK